MKIDLHCHTKEMFKGDGIKRNIDSVESSKNIMKEANVGIVAITNHDIFDLTQFENLKDESYLLLPGIELNAIVKNKRVQLNVIYSPDKVTDFSNKVIDNNFSDRSPKSIEEIVNIFDSPETLFLVDYKNTRSNTVWDHEQIKIFENIDKKGIVLVDSNNAKTNNILMAHNFKSLIGSDVINWDDYLKNDVSRLIDTPWDIKDFKNFCQIISYGDTTAFKELVSQRKSLIPKTDFEIVDKSNKYLIKNVEFFEGVNVIFGPKATGKSILLQKVFELNPNNSVIYDSSKKDIYFENLLKNSGKLSNATDEKVLKLNELLVEISNFKETSYSKFGDICRSFNVAQKINIQNTGIKNISEPDEKQINSAQTHLTNAFVSLDNIFKSDLKTIETIKQNISSIFELLWIKYVDSFKDWRLYQLKEAIIKGVSEIISKNGGVTSIPNKIGLYEKWDSRNTQINKIKNLKSLSFTETNPLQEYVIPDRGKIILYEEVKTVPFGTKMDKDNEIAGVKKTNYNNEFMKIFNNKISEKLEWTSVATKDFLENNKFYGVRRYIMDSAGNENLSNGEKSYISLMSKLNEDKKFFCLDEPGTFLGSKMISEYFLSKIGELKSAGKCIIITTHLGSVGLNTIPINMIFRNNIGINDYETYVGSIIENKFTETTTNANKDFQDVVVNNFEGGIKHFEFRKGIYEN